MAVFFFFDLHFFTKEHIHGLCSVKKHNICVDLWGLKELFHGDVLISIDLGLLVFEIPAWYHYVAGYIFSFHLDTSFKLPPIGFEPSRNENSPGSPGSKTMLKVLVAAADTYRLQTYFAHLFPTTDLGWIGAWGWRFCQRPPQMYPSGGFFTVIHRIGVEPPTNSIQGKSVVHEVSPIGYPYYQWRNYTPWN